MSSSNSSWKGPLTGRILAGYTNLNGLACVRHTVAGAYVGYLIEQEDDGFLKDVAVTVADGQTKISFTANFGNIWNVKLHTEKDLDWQFGIFGAQRVMGAIGPVGGDGNCDAEGGTALQYHYGLRGLTDLGFPGMGKRCN